jgi:sialate O-acetylesterase
MFAVLAAAVVPGAEAKVTLGTPFKDKMVLQRQMDLPVWGRADPGEKVTVAFAGHSVSTVAGADGKWSVKLPAMEASAEERVLAANDVEVKGVLVGEVWFCAGQSNAELPLVGDNPHFTDREGKMIAQITHKRRVRFAYCSNYQWSAKPRDLYQGSFTAWKEFIPENLSALPSFSAMGVYFALQLHSELEIPIGIVGAYWGGTNIDAWTPREGYDGMATLQKTADYEVVEQEQWNDDRRQGVIGDPHQQPTVLFNSMVSPWTPYAMRGLIWYQGCHNAAEGALYCDKMHALYNGWSKVFRNPGLKLYFVQLAPWSSSWWDIQLAQEKFADEQKNAGMIVTGDIGNTDDIHPNDKGTVGRRLAALALKRDYGFDDIVADYPRVISADVRGREVVVKCSNVKWWGVYNSNWDVAVPFELLGEDGVWRKARLVNSNVGHKHGNPWVTQGRVMGVDLHVFCEDIVEPKGIRHLHEHPWYSSLIADSGLPLAPFIIELGESR